MNRANRALARIKKAKSLAKQAQSAAESAQDSALECGSTGAPGPVLFQRSPGQHTYELRYEEECSGSGTASFSGRGLWVRPVR